MILLNDGSEHHFLEEFQPDIEVIAYALSHINRYNGHVGCYSVAQHCCLVADQLDEEYKLSGLLHDAHEAFIGDISAPLKRFLPDFHKIEQWYHRKMDLYFDVETQHLEVKHADLKMLITEASSFGMDLSKFPKVEPYDIKVTPWLPKTAMDGFLARFALYTED